MSYPKDAALYIHVCSQMHLLKELPYILPMNITTEELLYQETKLAVILRPDPINSIHKNIKFLEKIENNFHRCNMTLKINNSALIHYHN